ncbi:hypothetical protein WJX72_008347 [[Myrmecia] bisecta]|uniref:Probable ubiquitin carboxyl-terminal hydrolase MINDY-4 n=1 Tax=[Myrmecia] bisecta TaxID=41462 RepID=A0AAW1PTP0_9CHLO
MAFNRTTPAVAEALVREYLTKHGLHDSIKAFELEQPRTATSISSRSALRQSLGLERTPAKLKRLLPDLELPRTTLELWVEYQLQKLAGHDGCKLAVPEKLFSSTSAPMHKEHLIPAMPSLRLRDLPGSHGSGATRPLTAADLGGTADGIVRGSSGSYTSRPLTTRPLTADGLSLGDKPISMGSASTGGRQGAVSAHGLTHSARTSPVAETEPAMAVAPADALPITTLVLSVAADLSASEERGAELVIEDLEGDLGHDLGVCHTAVVRAVVEQQTHIPAEEMRSMRQLLFGRKCGPGLPWGAWKQGLFFNTTPGLTFGLVQKQGGPCGVLAAMQAHVLAALWDPVTGMHLHVDEAQQTAALCAAITAVLWQAGHQCSATLVGSSSSAATADLSFDELCRSASCRRFSSREALAEAVRALLPQYMQADGYGLLLLLFSVVLSHNVRQIQAERDEPESALIARHGYCSPDLVHLLLTGRAVANCFNGDRQLDGKVYRGISARSHLGLLTLFEHYKYVEVGSHLKSPHLPIWVADVQHSRYAALQLANSRTG